MRRCGLRVRGRIRGPVKQSLVQSRYFPLQKLQLLPHAEGLDQRRNRRDNNKQQYPNDKQRDQRFETTHRIATLPTASFTTDQIRNNVCQ